MKSSLLACFATLCLFGGSPSGMEYVPAVPGYIFTFPRDYFSHPDFRTEWWYYTGNLKSSDGHRFGFELTFFRHAVDERPRSAEGVWDVQQVWMAHLALSDIEGKQFLNVERMNRSGAGLAGADAARGLIWNGNWSAKWILDGRTPAGFREQTLEAVSERFTIRLMLQSPKPAAMHGTNGVSQKAAGRGQASHYFSLTHLNTSGTIVLDGKSWRVEGLSWMDHEFFSHKLDTSQSGWDWFSLQFTDGAELMLYRLRRKDGSLEPFSSGTWIAADGSTRHLTLTEFSLEPGRTWRSAQTNGNYPVEWTIRLPPLSLVCKVRALLDAQELVARSESSPTYWEGAVEVSGTRGTGAIAGNGYLEMTGYASRGLSHRPQ